MSNAVRIDARAFARGVDEVLLLKPVRRAVHSIVLGRGKPTVSEKDTCYGSKRTNYVIKRQRKHDEPAG